MAIRTYFLLCMHRERKGVPVVALLAWDVDSDTCCDGACCSRVLGKVIKGQTDTSDLHTLEILSLNSPMLLFLIRKVTFKNFLSCRSLMQDKCPEINTKDKLRLLFEKQLNRTESL